LLHKLVYKAEATGRPGLTRNQQPELCHPTIGAGNIDQREKLSGKRKRNAIKGKKCKVWLMARKGQLDIFLLVKLSLGKLEAHRFNNHGHESA
jgi:hypothetical protein